MQYFADLSKLDYLLIQRLMMRRLRPNARYVNWLILSLYPIVLILLSVIPQSGFKYLNWAVVVSLPLLILFSIIRTARCRKQCDDAMRNAPIRAEIVKISLDEKGFQLSNSGVESSVNWTHVIDAFDAGKHGVILRTGLVEPIVIPAEVFVDADARTIALAKINGWIAKAHKELIHSPDVAITERQL